MKRAWAWDTSRIKAKASDGSVRKDGTPNIHPQIVGSPVKRPPTRDGLRLFALWDEDRGLS